MARSVARLRPGLLGLALLVGCLDPTQATLLISTNVTCGPESAEPGALFETGILAAPASRVDEVSFTVTTKECSAGDVGSIVVFPEDGASEAAVVVVGSIGSQTAEGCLPFARRVPMADGNQCIVARRRISFISHKKLEIPIVLDLECVGVDCAGEQTCEVVGGAPQCVDARVVCDGAECTPGGEGGGASSSSSSSTGGGGGAGGGATVEPFYSGPALVSHLSGVDKGSAPPAVYFSGFESNLGYGVYRRTGVMSAVKETGNIMLPISALHASPGGAAVDAFVYSFGTQVQGRDPSMGPIAFAAGTTPTDVAMQWPNIYFVDGTSVYRSTGGQPSVLEPGGPSFYDVVDAAGGLVVATGLWSHAWNSAVGSIASEDPGAAAWIQAANLAYVVSEQGTLTRLRLQPGFFTIEAVGMIPMNSNQLKLLAAHGRTESSSQHTLFGVGNTDRGAYIVRLELSSSGIIGMTDFVDTAVARYTDVWVDPRPGGPAYVVGEDQRIYAVTF